jgi:hypothetical protein
LNALPNRDGGDRAAEAAIAIDERVETNRDVTGSTYWADPQ